MNLSINDMESYRDNLLAKLTATPEEVSKKVDIVLAVPNLFLNKASDVFSKTPVKISAQNVHWEDKGAFTGEISCHMLKESGVEASILGHSERRALFLESNESIKKKFAKALKESVLPILCVGETKKQREENQTFSVLERQLQSCLVEIKPKDSFIVAYEPVWAIGTGLIATKEQAQEAHNFIRAWLKENINEETSKKTRILYGGSMKPEVTQELLSQPDIDGGLVGGASLDPKTFAEMINIAYKQK